VYCDNQDRQASELFDSSLSFNMYECLINLKDLKDCGLVNMLSNSQTLQQCFRNR
jgi:hypothetical protein